MKRRTEHLVEKRDGRREFLRATKLARSIHLAMFEVGIDEDWRALELATVVLEGLRERRNRGDGLSAGGHVSAGPVATGPASTGTRSVGSRASDARASDARASGARASGQMVLTTTELADAVQHILVVTGQPAAAVSYGAVQAERLRRRQSVATLAGTAGGARAADGGDQAARFGDRWPGEG